MSETLTVSIESKSVRAAVISGKNIVRWAEAPLPAGAVSGGVVVDPNAVSGALKGLLVSLKISRVRPIVSVSGVRSFYRYLTIPKMEKALLDRAVLHDLEDSIHVPQDQLYINWVRVRGSGDEENVFVVASPRNAIDSAVDSIRLAGLKVPVLDCKPLALARLARFQDAVIVDVEPDVMHLVVIKRGRPTVIRTVPLSNCNAAELPGQLREEVDATLRLYESIYYEDPTNVGMLVYLSGSCMRLIESLQALSDGLQRPVELLPPAMKHPAGMPWPDMAVNAGLALRLTERLWSRHSSVPKVDLLPLSYRPAQRPVTQLVFGPVVAVGILMIASAYQAYDQAMARSELASAEVKVMQGKMRVKQAEVKRLNDLQQTLAQNEIALRRITEERSMLVPETPAFLDTLRTVYTQTDNKILLSAVSQSGGKLLINGMALDHRGVLDYADRLTASKVFAKVDIRESSTALLTDDKQDGIYRFIIGGEVRALVKGDSVTSFTIAATR
jgi:Tfp pilus assembly protein PilN